MTDGATTEGIQARRYLRARHSGVLSTLSQRLGGYPFGSIVPFVLDHDAAPVILVSRLAEHTRNIAADPRSSLFVHDAAEDVQAGARLTLAGDARRTDNDAIAKRYLRYHPEAGRLLALGDFGFVRIAPVFVRHIAGFGAIRSIAAGSYAPPANALAEVEDDLIGELNASEHALLAGCWKARTSRMPESAALIGVDVDGFDLRADGHLLRFEFAATVTEPDRLRDAIAAVAEGRSE